MNVTKKLIGIMCLVVFYAGLTGCDFDAANGIADAAASDVPAEDTIGAADVATEEPTVSAEAEDDFPVEALAIRPEPTEERRDEGNKGDSENYYLNIVIFEEVGCMRRRVEVRGSFYKNDSEYWSPGQTTSWDNERTEANVKIMEDASACGGYVFFFENTAYAEDFSFGTDGKSVTFYADVPVYDWYAQEERLVTISIDSSGVADGEKAGGNISSSKNVEWGYEFDSESDSAGEGVNLTLNGGIYIDQLAVVGETHAKVSKYTYDYSNNGKRPEDPFNCCTTGGGKG